MMNDNETFKSHKDAIEKAKQEIEKYYISEFDKFIKLQYYDRIILVLQTTKNLKRLRKKLRYLVGRGNRNERRLRDLQNQHRGHGAAARSSRPPIGRSLPGVGGDNRGRDGVLPPMRYDGPGSNRSHKWSRPGGPGDRKSKETKKSIPTAEKAAEGHTGGV